MKLRLLITQLLLSLVIFASATEVTDTITGNNSGITKATGSTISYVSSNTLTDLASTAKYNLNAAYPSGGYLQFRSKNSNSGLVTTSSGGKVSNITVKWNSETLTNRVINIYGKTSAYDTPADLYDSSKYGTLIGTITFDGSTAKGELAITGNYTFVGLRSNDGALYLDKIDITWNTDGGSGSSLTPLSSPSNLTTTNITSTEATLSWDAVANASSYKVTINGTTYSSITTNSYVVSGLSASTEYTWKVTAIGDGTTYSNSLENSASFTTSAASTTTYTITPLSCTGGVVTADVSTAASGATVTLTAAPSDGYTFTNAKGSWVITNTSNKNAIGKTVGTGYTCTFTMPAANVTVSATFTAASATTSHSITIGNCTGGSITSDKTSAEEGETVTLTATPGSGYSFTNETASWKINNGAITPTIGEDNTCTFSMPNENVNVIATFVNVNPCATYTVIDVDSVQTTGTVPLSSKATYAQTYSTKYQIINNKTATLTLKGYDGYKITGIVLNMASNASKGAGSFSAVVGTDTIASLSKQTFNNWYDNTAYGATRRDVTVNMTDAAHEVEEGDSVVITITGSTNSLYIYTYTIYFVKVDGSASPIAPITSFGTANLNLKVGDTYTQKVSTNSNGKITYVSSNTSVATVDSETGEVTTLATGTATITASTVATDEFLASSAAYTITVTEDGTASGDVYYLYLQPFGSNVIDDGDYVIVCSYNDVAMNNVVSSNKLGHKSVDIVDNKIIAPTDSIVWTIAKNSSGYYTIKNKKSTTYAAGTGTKLQLTLSSSETADKSQWKVLAGYLAFDFINKNDTAFWMNYSSAFLSSSATNYENIKLYKKEDKPATPATVFPIPTKDLTLGQYSYQTVFTTSNGKVTYSSSDPTKVTVDEEGKVTALAEATDIIITANTEATANYQQSSATYKITVQKPASMDFFNKALAVEKGHTLKNVCIGADSYSVANSAIASVDNSGEVKGLEVGFTEITATNTTTNETAKYTLTVYDKTCPIFESEMQAIVAERNGKYYAMLNKYNTDTRSGLTEGYFAREVEVATDENGELVVVSPFASDIAWQISKADEEGHFTIRSGADGKYLNHPSTTELILDTLSINKGYSLWEWNDEIGGYAFIKDYGEYSTIRTFLMRYHFNYDAGVFKSFSIKQNAGTLQRSKTYTNEYTKLPFYCNLRYAWSEYPGKADSITYVCIDKDPELKGTSGKTTNYVGVLTVADCDKENMPAKFTEADNVIANDNTTHLNLTDGLDFYAPYGSNMTNKTFTADAVSYSRDKVGNGWNSVCLPFDIKSSDITSIFGTGSGAYVLTALDKGKKTLTFTNVTGLSTDSNVKSEVMRRTEDTGSSYTVTFKSGTDSSDGSSTISSTDDIISEGKGYLTVSAASNVFPGKTDYGIRLGSGSKKGSITLTPTTLGTVKPTKIVVNTCYYNKDAKDLLVYINGATTANKTLDLTNSFADYEISMDGKTDLTSIMLEASATSDARAYVNSITVYYGGSSGSGDSGDTGDTGNTSISTSNCVVDGTIKAGTPFLVHCTNETSAWNIDKHEGHSAVGESIKAGDTNASMQGTFITTTSIINGDGWYKLAADGSKFGFAKSGSKIKPFRLALQIGSTSDVNGFSLLFEEEMPQEEEIVTSIGEQIEAQEKEPAIYDLNGRRIYKVTLPGIYVVNGKKVVKK